MDIRDPKWTEVKFDNIPSELKRRPNWCIWTPTPRSNGKIAKRPINPNTMTAAKINAPETWGTYAEAVAAIAKAAAQGKRYGLEYMFCGRDDYVITDLDYCFTPSGMLKPHAAKLLDMLKPTYIDKSPSRSGIHIITKAYMPTDRLITPASLPYKIEFYKRQPLTITGDIFGGMNEIRDNYDEFIRVLWTYCPETMSDPTRGGYQGDDDDNRDEAEQVKAQQVKAQRPQVDDAEVIRKLCADPVRRSCWNGDSSRYNGDASAGDFGLLNHIRYWSGSDDPADIDRLFRQSGRMRPKWDERHYQTGETYGERSIKSVLLGTNKSKRTK